MSWRVSVPARWQDQVVVAVAATVVSSCTAFVCPNPAPDLPDAPERLCTRLENPILVAGWQEDVVAVKVDGCRVEPLPECRLKQDYTVEDASERIVRFVDGEAIADAVLPLDGGRFYGGAQRGGALLVVADIREQRRVSAVGPGDLEGQCGDATHYVQTFFVGKLSTGELGRRVVLEPQAEGAVALDLAPLNVKGGRPAASQACESWQYYDSKKEACLRLCPLGEQSAQGGDAGNCVVADLPLPPGVSEGEFRRLVEGSQRAASAADKEARLFELWRAYPKDAIPAELLVRFFRGLDCSGSESTEGASRCGDPDRVAHALGLYAKRLGAAGKEGMEPADEQRRWAVYERILSHHPSSPSAADAFLEGALANCANGEASKALSLFDRIVKEYPDSDAAKRVQELNRECP